MKRILLTICAVLLFMVAIGLGFCYFLYPWITFGEREWADGARVDGFVEEALRVPYRAYIKPTTAIKEDLEDLEEISQEEWMAMECKCPDVKNQDFELSDTKNRLEKHLCCIEPGIQHFPRSGYHKKWLPAMARVYFHYRVLIRFTSMNIY